MANFEVFKGQRVVRNAPAVTLQRTGLVSLNRAAFEALGEPEAVELLFDRDHWVIGMRPTCLDCAYAHPVRKQSTGSGFVISGRGFTQHYGIPIERATRYPAELKDGILTVDL